MIGPGPTWITYRVHEPVGEVDDEELLGGTDAEAVKSALTFVVRGLSGRTANRRQQRRCNGASMPTYNDENLGVGNKHDDGRNDVGENDPWEQDTSLMTADCWYEKVPAEAALCRWICGSEQPTRWLRRGVLSISQRGDGLEDYTGPPNDCVDGLSRYRSAAVVWIIYKATQHWGSDGWRR